MKKLFCVASSLFFCAAVLPAQENIQQKSIDPRNMKSNERIVHRDQSGRITGSSTLPPGSKSTPPVK